ncbi:hypothetical protein D3C85_1592380 [compost metagenome]
MAVAADNQAARQHMAALGQHHMADAFGVDEVGAGLARPVAREAQDRLGLGIAARHEMIGHHHVARRVPHAGAKLFQ